MPVSRTDQTLWDNPLGTDGFEFVEYAAPDPGGAWRPVRATWFRCDRAPPLEKRAPLPAGRNQLHRQRRAGQFCAGVRARARPVDLRHRLSGEGRGRGVSPGDRAGRLGRRSASRPDGTQHSRDQGHRRFADLSRRSLCPGRDRCVDLRRRLRAAGRRGPASARRRTHLHRSPDAQRASRPDGRSGRASTSACSISARCAISTSRAS